MPLRLYPATTKAVFHLLSLRYDQRKFKNMPRALFLEALRAEGVPYSSGYVPLHTQPFIKAAFESKLYRKAYAPNEIDYTAFIGNNQCPANDRICNEAVWMTQNLLLAGRSAMDDIANAIEKIYENATLIMQKKGRR